MPSNDPLTARNFPSAEEDASVAQPPSRYGGPESAFRLAFTDTDFLLREELRPVRMQLELLKPELVQAELGITSTIVIFGSARIKEKVNELQRIARDVTEIAAEIMAEVGFRPKRMGDSNEGL
mgnify:CR=1 FL=1